MTRMRDIVNAAADIHAEMCEEIYDDPRDRFDVYDDPFYEDPPNCYGTVASFDCEFTRCQFRSTCYIAYTNHEASRRAGI